MPNFTCKKLNYMDHLDYSFIVAHDYGNDLNGLKNELKAHLTKIMKDNSNRDKVINVLTNLFCNFNGALGAEKREVLDACFFYGEQWTDFQAFERYNCLLALTFDNYRETLRAITDCGYGLFTIEDVKSKLQQRVDWKLSDATIADQLNQIIGTMVGIGAVKRYKRGLYKLQKWPVFDAVSIYIVLKTYEALAKLEDASWFMKCFNFEIGNDFIKFFPEFNYSKIAGKKVYNKLVSSECGSMRLSMGVWTYSNDEMVYDVGKSKTELMRNLYVTIKDVKKALHKDVFNGWNDRQAA